jgi:O-antigen/teichoic acid export membrane protein
MSIGLSLAAMFIVIPIISDNKAIYGVYSVCISAAMFLSYADLGFVRAGIKYAGESYAKGDYDNEVRYYGFFSFVLFIFILIVSAIFILFSYYPSLLIKDISGSESISVASRLLFIQAIFSYNIVLQRFVTGVFDVRIEQYVFQRINIIASIIKLTSVLFFFGNGKYDIVGYFLFLKIIDLVTLIVGLAIINSKYEFSLIKYLKAFKFDKAIFFKTKGLAFSSIFVTFMWILYYELDIIVIGKLLGASAVAIFALAFTFMKFLRSLSSFIFSPFQNRYNHFIGLDDFIKLKALLNKVIILSMPIFVFSILSIIILSNKIVLSWAGIEYVQSGIILGILATNFIYSFIVIPGTNMLVSLVRLKDMYSINTIMVVVFWSGVLLTMNHWGVLSFAIFKLVSGTLAMLFYLRFLLRYLNKTLLEFLKQTVFRLFIPIIIQISFLQLVIGYLPEIKGDINLIIVLGCGIIGSLLGFISLYLTSTYYNREMNGYLTKILIQNK